MSLLDVHRNTVTIPTNRPSNVTHFIQVTWRRLSLAKGNQRFVNSEMMARVVKLLRSKSALAQPAAIMATPNVRKRQWLASAWRPLFIATPYASFADFHASTRPRRRHRYAKLPVFFLYWAKSTNIASERPQDNFLSVRPNLSTSRHRQYRELAALA